MANTTKKAFDFGRVLFDKLSLRYGYLATPLTVVQSFDTTGNPVLSIGTVSAGNQCLVIRVLPVASIGVDSLGLAQNSYTPHIVQICTELSATSGIDILTEANKLPALGECLRLGMRTELYQSANGVAPATAQMTSGNLVAFFDNLESSLTGSV